MDLIKIDPKQITIWAEESGKLIFKPEAEKAFDELLKHQKLVNETVENVLKGIKEAGEAINPDFKGVKGEKYVIRKQQFGNRYTFKQAKAGQLGAFLKPVSYNTVNSEAVDAYLETVGELPEGIEYKDREYKMVIKEVDSEED
jgi:hypothetical protein